MAKENIGELAVPIDILRRSNGFAMDIGKWPNLSKRRASCDNYLTERSCLKM